MRTAALLTVLAAFAIQPAAAPAAQSPYVVYELVRVKPGGPAYVPVKTETTAREGLGVVAMVHLAPRTGGGYTYREAAIATLSGNTRWRTYGWPVAAPACPSALACGNSTDAIRIGITRAIRVGAGDRILVGGLRGVLKISAYPPQWRVRQTTLALRTVYAEAADATGFGTYGFYAEHLRSARAPSGGHGSLAFAGTPCDPGAGTATLASADAATRKSWTCNGVFGGSAFGETYRGGDWSLSGNVVGFYTDPLRLLVLDYPKR